MNRVNIKMKLTNVSDPTVTVNGAPVDFKKSGNDYIGTVDTEFDTVELEVFRFHELNGALWALWALLFFVFSMFGIFDARLDGKCICIRYKATLHLGENTSVTLAFNHPKAGTKAVECRCDCEAEQTANEYYLDETAKKRTKILRIIKILSWVALVIIAVIAVVLSIVL